MVQQLEKVKSPTTQHNHTQLHPHPPTYIRTCTHSRTTPTLIWSGHKAHTLSQAVGSNLYSLRTSCTAPACPSWAAQWSMVKPLWSVLLSRASILEAKHLMVPTWPPFAARCRAFRPSCIIHKGNAHTHTPDCMANTGSGHAHIMHVHER